MTKLLEKSSTSSTDNQLDLLSLYMTCLIFGNIHKETSFEQFEYYLKTYGYYVNVKNKGDNYYRTFTEKDFDNKCIRDKVTYIEFYPKYTGKNYMRVLKKEIRILLHLDD